MVLYDEAIYEDDQNGRNVAKVVKNLIVLK